jgi:uncharacterized membrane protein YeaQ/YmgE (transglycosylase-associated protein family)
MISKHLEAIAQKLNLKRSSDSVFGDIHGQPTQVSFEKVGRNQFYYVRFLSRRMDPSFVESLKTTLPGDSKIKLRQLKVESGVQQTACQMLTWGPMAYPFKDKASEEIPPGVEFLASRMKDRFGSSSETCSYCNAETKDLVLLNNRPLVICPSCLNKKEHEFRTQQTAFEELRPNYLLGALAGFAGSVVGATLWVGAIVATQKDYLLLSILAGFLCGWLYKKVAKKIDHLGRALIFAITLAGFFTAQVLHIAYLVHEEQGTWDLAGSFSAYLLHLQTEAVPMDVLMAYLFPILGAAYAVFFVFPKDSMEFVVDRGNAAAAKN